MNYLYILKSIKDGNSYIGYTVDLKRRFSEHNKGLVKSTKFRRPFKLIYYEAYSNLKDAIKREHSLKLKSNAYSQLRKRIRNSLD